MTAETDNGTVLVVDDEEDVAEAYSLWLSDGYEVRTATGGEEAMEKLGGADLVLLDRRMPEVSGDEVLERIREEGNSCRVAMVTAVDPDFDIIDMEFDDYVTKPVDREELNEVVDRLLRLNGLNESLSDHFALAQKAAALRTEKSADELESHERYNEIVDEMEEAKSEIDAEVQDDELADVVYRDL
jgi:DNA-binding response OmpR family regulator